MVISASTSALASAARPMPRRLPAFGLVTWISVISTSPRLSGTSRTTLFSSGFMRDPVNQKRSRQNVAGYRELKAERRAVFRQTVNTVDDFQHVDGIDFNQLFTVDGQFEVSTVSGDFGFAIFTLFVFTKIKLFVTAAHCHFYSGNFTGVVALEGAGEAQGNICRTAPLLQHQLINAADRPLQGQRVIIQTEVYGGSTTHTASPVFFQLASQFLFCNETTTTE